MSLRRTAAVPILALTVLLTLAGCAAAPESRLDEYRAEAERLNDELIAAIPAEVKGTTGMMDSRMTLGSDIASHDDPASPAWWSVNQSVTPAPVADAAKGAAAAIGAHLASAGWSEKQVRADDERTVDGYRKDGWYAEVAWYATVAGKAETLDLSITSPETVRGDH